MKNKTLKVILFFAITILVTHLTLVASFAQETLGLRSETATLEALYQEKASAYLSKLVNPDDYTLVVTATIRNDEQKLKEYKDAVEKKYLPGLIMQDPMGFSDAHNLLMDLKQKVEVQVVLSDNVPSDRDTMIKDMLRTNLKLNEESGDTITTVRAIRPVVSPETPIAARLPELTARMIAFLILLSLFITAAIAFWLHKRREAKKALEDEEKKAEAAIINAKAAEIENADEEKVEEEIVEEVVAKTPDQIEAERDALEMKLAFAKGELIKLSKEYPNIVCRAAEEFSAQGRIADTVTFMEALGWDQSKRLFKEIESRIWTRIGAALRERTEDPSSLQIYEAVHVFHRFALSFVLERAGRDSENPFAFIFQLTTSQRIDLLTNEKASNIALIAIYCSGPQMGELLNNLNSEKQNEVLLNITKIKQMPEIEIRASVEDLLIRLERIKADPNVHVDGPTLAADFMRSLSPVREEELFQTLQASHPEEAEKIRRVRVMFQDIPNYPTDMVRKTIEAYESDELMKALVGFDSAFAETFLNLLPTKKALMIQNDLYHMSEFPPASQCAENRRKICAKIELEFEAQRFSITEFWRQFDNAQAQAQAANYSEPRQDDQYGDSVSEENTEVIETEVATNLVSELPEGTEEIAVNTNITDNISQIKSAKELISELPPFEGDAEDKKDDEAA